MAPIVTTVTLAILAGGGGGEILRWVRRRFIRQTIAHPVDFDRLINERFRQLLDRQDAEIENLTRKVHDLEQENERCKEDQKLLQEQIDKLMQEKIPEYTRIERVTRRKRERV